MYMRGRTSTPATTTYLQTSECFLSLNGGFVSPLFLQVSVEDETKDCHSS